VRFPLISLIAIVSCIPVPAAKLEVSQLPAEEVKKGTAVIGEGPDFLFAFESAKQPTLFIDGQPVGPMKRSGKNGPWTYQA
jgi:hypothetical protein